MFVPSGIEIVNEELILETFKTDGFSIVLKISPVESFKLTVPFVVMVAPSPLKRWILRSSGTDCDATSCVVG